MIDLTNLLVFLHFQLVGGHLPYISSDEALHVENGSSREHWLEHVLSLFSLAICEEPEGGMVFPESLIQCLLLVPACSRAVDVLIRRGVCKMELWQLMSRSRLFPVLGTYFVGSYANHVA